MWFDRLIQLVYPNYLKSQYLKERPIKLSQNEAIMRKNITILRTFSCSNRC
jgi:hypothetical protein